MIESIGIVFFTFFYSLVFLIISDRSDKKETCCVINRKNHVMDGDFGLKNCRYGYCQIHKIEGTAEETTPNLNNTKVVDNG